MDYKNSKIYVIRNHCNDSVYVGSTTQSLSRRFSWHKAQMNFKKFQLYEAFINLGIENFYIELLELYPCSCRDELRSREGYYIRKFDSYKNGYNMKIAGRTMKDYYEDNKEKIKQKTKDYYEDNKELIKQKTKDYRENNKDNINEYSKKYYQDNKEKIREHKNKKFNCECGGKYTQINKSRHLKTKKHLNHSRNANY